MSENESIDVTEEEIIEESILDEEAVEFIMRMYDKTFRDLANR